MSGQFSLEEKQKILDGIIGQAWVEREYCSVSRYDSSNLKIALWNDILSKENGYDDSSIILVLDRTSGQGWYLVAENPTQDIEIPRIDSTSHVPIAEVCNRFLHLEHFNPLDYFNLEKCQEYLGAPSFISINSDLIPHIETIFDREEYINVYGSSQGVIYWHGALNDVREKHHLTLRYSYSTELSENTEQIVDDFVNEFDRYSDLGAEAAKYYRECITLIKSGKLSEDKLLLNPNIKLTEREEFIATNNDELCDMKSIKAMLPILFIKAKECDYEFSVHNDNCSLKVGDEQLTWKGYYREDRNYFSDSMYGELFFIPNTIWSNDVAIHGYNSIKTKFEQLITQMNPRTKTPMSDEKKALIWGLCLMNFGRRFSMGYNNTDLFISNKEGNLHISYVTTSGTEINIDEVQGKDFVELRIPSLRAIEGRYHYTQMMNTITTIKNQKKGIEIYEDTLRGSYFLPDTVNREALRNYFATIEGQKYSSSNYEEERTIPSKGELLAEEDDSRIPDDGIEERCI